MSPEPEVQSGVRTAPLPLNRRSEEGILSRVRYGQGLAVAVAIGLALRLWFNVGFVGGFPQDDGIYVNVARLLVAGVDLVARYRDLDPSYAANPAENFTFRIAYLYPLSWCFRLFGEGDRAATLVGIVTALLSIVVIAEIGRAAISDRAGVAAAFLLATFPHDVILTTRVLTDGLLRLFVALACLFVIRGWPTGSPRAFALGGLALGLAYLTKIPGAALFAVFGIVLAVRCLKRRAPLPFVAYVAGFASVVLAETIWYWWRTGQMFLHYRILRSSILAKLQFEPVAVSDVGPYLRVLWEGEFLWYAPLVLGLTSVGYYSFAGFGAHGWVWLAGLVPTVRGRSRGALVLIGLAVGLYLFVEFFPLDVRLTDGRLQYALVYRQWRFASLLTPAWVPLGGALLAWIWEKSTAAAAVVLVVTVVSGWPSFIRNYDALRGSQSDMRAVAAFIENRPEPIYTDRFAVSILQYYLGSAEHAKQLRDLSTLRGALPAKGDLVIIGGSRGIEILAEVWEADLPAWCRSALDAPDVPPGWRLLLRIPGTEELTRLHDLLILQRVDP
ncbi:MAG: ArnT family glycosyltransferase [Vicinamibacterales bacterium]